MNTYIESEFNNSNEDGYSCNTINLFKEEPYYNLVNHIIILGEIQDFLGITENLRNFSDRPILFFSEQNISQEKWKLMNNHPNLLYYFGTYSNTKHLDKLQISNAFKILLLPTCNLNTDFQMIIATRFPI